MKGYWLSFFFFLLFIVLCVEGIFSFEPRHFSSLQTSKLSYVPEIKTVSFYAIITGLLEYLPSMIMGYFHTGCHCKVKNLQGQSHHLSSTRFPDTQSCSEMASGFMHNKDLAPCHCLSLDLCWESFKRGFTKTIARLLFRGRAF